MGASAAAVIIIRKEKDLVRHFRDAGATSAASAKAAAALGVHERFAWAMLLRRGIIQESAPGTFYLDEAEWEESRQRKRKLAVVMFVAVFAAAFAAAYATINASRR